MFRHSSALYSIPTHLEHVHIRPSDSPCILFVTNDVPFCLGGSIEEEREPSIVIRDTAVETVIISMDSDGNIVDEMIGLAMVF